MAHALQPRGFLPLVILYSILRIITYKLVPAFLIGLVYPMLALNFWGGGRRREREREREGGREGGDPYYTHSLEIHLYIMCVQLHSYDLMDNARGNTFVYELTFLLCISYRCLHQSETVLRKKRKWL